MKYHRTPIETQMVNTKYIELSITQHSNHVYVIPAVSRAAGVTTQHS